jgi:hypothetical protein
LAERLSARPADFTFDELTALLGRYGCAIAASGRTSGSRAAFTNGRGDYIRLHRPHPGNILKLYQVDDIIAALKERGLL